MFIGREVISFNDNLYELIRTFKDKEGFPIAEAKEYYNCDTTLKKEGVLYFCRVIKEAQVIENDEQIQLVEKEQKAKATPKEKRNKK